MLKAYKYRLYPTKTQEVLLSKHFGCARYIYNYGLERKIKSYSETKKSVSRFTIQADLPKLKKALKRLKRLQRSVSRKKKGSNSRKKAVKLLARQYEKVTNKRKDFLHKTSKYLIDHYDTICLETLSASNMLKNHRLAQALSDISIGTFNAYMDYKAEWCGKNIIRIGRFEPSSKMCSCGNVHRGLKLSDRVWTCPACGAVNQRDLLAARNIKKFAFKLNNTARIAGIYAEDSMHPVMGAASEIIHADDVETHTSLACG